MGPTPCFESSLPLMTFFSVRLYFHPVSTYSDPIYPILILFGGVKCPLYHPFCPMTELNAVIVT